MINEIDIIRIHENARKLRADFLKSLFRPKRG